MGIRRRKGLFNSLAKKILLAVVLVSVVIVVLVSIAVPKLFYRYLKEEAVKRVEVAVESSGVRANMGFLLFIHYVNDERLYEQLMGEDLLAPEKFARNGEEIVKRLDERENFNEGQRYEGMILSDGVTNYVSHDIQKHYQDVLESDAYQNYVKEGESAVYFMLQLEGEYYIASARAYEEYGKTYHFISMILWDKFFQGFDAMEEVGIVDYAVYYEETKDLMWSSEVYGGETGKILPLPIDTEELWTNWNGETKDGYDFVMPCSFEEGPQRAILVYHMSREQLLSGYQYMFWFIRAILIGAFLISAVCIFILVNQSVEKIRRLSREMKRVEQGDYSVCVEIRTGDEIEELGNTFNQMIGTINENIRRIVEQEKKENEMRYTVLISEIDPHFIYNTLNTITYLAAMKRNEDITKVSKALITILKDRLKIKEYLSFDSVKNEMELNNQYMEIQKYMHGDNVQLIWEVEEELQTAIIPKSILQPLVENALVHGIYHAKDESGRIKAGTIRIRLWREDENVHILVSDTGVGMTEEKIEEFFGKEAKIQEAGSHIGIRNIRMRLYYLYQENYRLEAASRAGEGCRVSVVFPFLTERGEHPARIVPT